MALFTGKMAKYRLQDCASEGSITPTGLCLCLSDVGMMLQHLTDGHLPCRSCWCFLGATRTMPIQPASPWKSAPMDSPALRSSLCHHKQNIRSFWKVMSDKGWHVSHLLGQVSTVEAHSFKRKARRLTSWFGQNSDDCCQEGHLQWMWKMNRRLTGLAHQTFKNKIKFWWGENSK